MADRVVAIDPEGLALEPESFAQFLIDVLFPRVTADPYRDHQRVDGESKEYPQVAAKAAHAESLKIAREAIVRGGASRSPTLALGDVIAAPLVTPKLARVAAHLGRFGVDRRLVLDDRALATSQSGEPGGASGVPQQVLIVELFGQGLGEPAPAPRDAQFIEAAAER